jgi:predicted enzyme related to lactoylglutathione lyase
MKNQGIHMSWIVVSDLKKAVKFFSETVGLKVNSVSEEYNWAELKGEDGSSLGIAGASPRSPVQAGSNAVVTFTVPNLAQACEEMVKKGATLIGKVETVPGHVELQMFKDSDGNLFQLVQKLS